MIAIKEGAPFLFHGIDVRGLNEAAHTLVVSGSFGSGTLRMEWLVTGANDIGFVASDSMETRGGSTFLSSTASRRSARATSSAPSVPRTWTASGAVVSVRFDECLDCAAQFLGRAETNVSVELIGVDVLGGGARRAPRAQGPGAMSACRHPRAPSARSEREIR